MKITLKEAEKFHGHLGPYLVLGIIAGEAALKELGCGKYFGLEVRVSGANEKPRSCLIDGLQLSTGATYGKGNIHKLNPPGLKSRDSSRAEKAQFHSSHGLKPGDFCEGLNSDKIEISVSNREDNRKIKISLKKDLIRSLKSLRGHRDSESFARILFKTDPRHIFNLTTDN